MLQTIWHCCMGCYPTHGRVDNEDGWFIKSSLINKMVEFQYLVLCKHRMNLAICLILVHRRFVVCVFPSMLSDYKFFLLTVKGTDSNWFQRF
jgi:hypothetical protein